MMKKLLLIFTLVKMVDIGKLKIYCCVLFVLFFSLSPDLNSKTNNKEVRTVVAYKIADKERVHTWQMALQ